MKDSPENLKQLRYDKAYMKMAEQWGKLSHCKRKQVGALIVKDRMIISDGYNGTPTGFENFCEDEEGYTKWYVLHAMRGRRLSTDHILSRPAGCHEHLYDVYH